jgi:cytochrome c553
MRLPSLIKAVLWSFVGVRRRADATRDVEQAPAWMIVIVALIVAAVFIAGIASLVRLVAGTRERPAAGVSVEAPSPPTTTSPKLHGPVAVNDTMAERMVACTTCHGRTTQATKDAFSPRLAGKPAGYLFHQMVSFRDGRRTYPPMVYLVQYMTDGYMREIAEYFEQLDLPYPPPEPLTLPPQAIARARQLVEHGDAARDLPACVECHGESLSGLAPAIPGLLGLPSHYIAAQFGAWRGGKMRSLPPDCMGEVARRLAPDDIATLAAWLAAQSVPAKMKPGTQGSRRLPLTCGSVTAATR